MAVAVTVVATPMVPMLGMETVGALLSTLKELDGPLPAEATPAKLVQIAGARFKAREPLPAREVMVTVRELPLPVTERVAVAVPAVVNEVNEPAKFVSV